jgi:hypothetical protein
MEHKHKLLRQH